MSKPILANSMEIAHFARLCLRGSTLPNCAARCTVARTNVRAICPHTAPQQTNSRGLHTFSPSFVFLSVPSNGVAQEAGPGLRRRNCAPRETVTSDIGPCESVTSDIGQLTSDRSNFRVPCRAVRRHKISVHLSGFIDFEKATLI